MWNVLPPPQILSAAWEGPGGASISVNSAPPLCLHCWLDAGPGGAGGPAASGFYTPPLWGVPEHLSEGAYTLFLTHPLSSPSYFLLLTL